MELVHRQGLPEVPLGENYWTYHINPKTKWSQLLEATNHGSMVDRRRIKENMAFEKKEHAEEALKNAKRRLDE